jgi:hypothetical protein
MDTASITIALCLAISLLGMFALGFWMGRVTR